MKKNTLIILFISISGGIISFSSCQENPYRQGEILYQNFCANCHMSNGQGLRALYPPLAGADYLAEQDGRLGCLIRYGLEGPIEVNGQTFDMEMPGVEKLSPVEITNIINYIHHAWGNDLRTVKLEEVREELQTCRSR